MDPKETDRHTSAQTPAELARELRTSRRTIYAAIHSGGLAAVLIGKRWKILPQDRDRWIDKLRTSQAIGGANETTEANQ